MWRQGGGTHFMECECLLRYFLGKSSDILCDARTGSWDKWRHLLLVFVYIFFCVIFFKDPVAYDTCQIIVTVGQGITDLIWDKTELMIKSIKRGKSSYLTSLTRTLWGAMDYKINWVRTLLLGVYVDLQYLHQGKCRKIYRTLWILYMDVLLTLLSFPLLVCTR